MKIVGLTGGIGSGKTTVANFFKKLGVPIYIADVEAKKLMARSKVIKRKMIALLGEDAYKGTKPNRPFIATKIFNDESLLERVNDIIHPKVASHFKRWIKKQDAVYCIKEAAILFENGSYKSCDATILVIAPQKVRIDRVLQRDKITRDAVMDRIKNQWSDEEKLKLTTYTLQNITLQETELNVVKLHRKLLKKYK